jgi:hypothetical protein
MAVADPGDSVIRPAVDAAFAMLLRHGREWARDFVLGGWDDDAAGDVAALSNHFALRSGDAPEMLVVASLPAAAGAPLTSAACHVGGLWVPVWSQGGVTCGVVVEKVQAVPGFANVDSMPQPGEPEVLAVGRFARDERSGEGICLSKSSRSAQSAGGKAMATIWHWKTESSTRRSAVFLHCDYAALSCEPKVPASFVTTTILADVCLSERACPVCGREAIPQVCRCEIPFRAPRSALDYTHFKHNSVFHLGRFASRSHVFMRPAGDLLSPLQPAVIPTSLTLSATPEPQFDRFAHSMQTLGIQERLLSSAIPRSVTEASLFTGWRQALSSESADMYAVDARGFDMLVPMAEEYCPVDCPLSVGSSTGALTPMYVTAGDQSSFLYVCDDAPKGLFDEGAVEVELFPEAIDNPLKEQEKLAVFDFGTKPDFDCLYLFSSTISEEKVLSESQPSESQPWKSQPSERQAPEGRQIAGPKDAAKLERQRKNRLAAARSNERRRERRLAMNQELESLRLKERELCKKHEAVLACNSLLKERAAQMWLGQVRASENRIAS